MDDDNIVFYDNDYFIDEDHNDNKDEPMNEIGSLNPRLDFVHAESMLSDYERKAEQLWTNVLKPMMEEFPPGLCDKLDFARFWNFLLENSYGLNKLDLQVQLDEIKEKLE